ncbi:MAG: hypothetical protein IPH01_10995 [Elusimicrobia bacterium]|nr:hypothetical protein [Elusimicrobiota bacterium]
MPTRVLRDWTDSEAIDKLSWQAEVFFVRLIMKADDYGRFFGSPKILKSYLFPLKDGVRDTDIFRWIAECEKAGLILAYKNGQKSFLEITKFNQRMRSKTSKFPEPAINDGRMPVICQSEAGHPRSESESGGERRESLPLGLGGGLGEGEGNGNEISPPSPKNQDPAVERLVEFTGEEHSRGFFQKAVRALGGGLCEEAVGEVKMREARGSVADRGKYLVAILGDWMRGRGVAS